MRRLAFFAAAALASAALAQSPLVTLAGGTNSGNVGGGVYFDLQINTTVTINQIDFRCGANSLAGTGFIDVYLGPPTYLNNVANPGLWAIVASTTPAAVGPSVVVNGALASPFALGPGTYGVALKSNNHAHGYTNGVTCTSTTTPGACANSLFSTAEMTLRAGAAQNAFLTGGVFTPRIFNGAIHYTNGGTPVVVANWTPYGEGCYKRARSAYEFWPSSVFVDFGTVPAGGSGISSVLQALNATGDYTWTAGTNAVVTPTSAALGHADDQNLAITLDPLGPPIVYVATSGVTVAATVEMGSNGYLAFNGTLTPTLVPDPTPFLAATGAIVGNWHDFDPSPAGGGSTHYEFNAGLGAHMFTWNGVFDFGIAASPNTYQILIYGSGNIEHRWGVMSQAGGGGWPTVLGYTPGNGSYNPGSSDLSVRLQPSGFRTNNTDSPPLALALNNRPRLNTTVQFQITGGEPFPPQQAAILAVSLVGNYPNGTSMAGFPYLMPECSDYVVLLNPTMVSFFLLGSGVPPNPFATQNFTIPPGVQYNGTTVFAQAFGISSSFNVTSFGIGASASNGVRMVVGSL
jgi:hypothetical protein